MRESVSPQTKKRRITAPFWFEENPSFYKGDDDIRFTLEFPHSAALRSG